MTEEMIKGLSLYELKKEDFNKLKKWKEEEYRKIRSDLGLILEGQKINQKDLRLVFIGLALRNEELLKSNDQLKHQLDEVLKELSTIKQEREEKAARKEAWTNRKRLPKRDPMTREIYKELIKTAEGPTYINLRTRMALCILAVTGIRINELLPLKVSQLKTLFKENWIAIDRSKRGPSNHKAFLTKEGKKIMHDRQKDFELIFLMKEPDSYLFTAESNHYKPLDRVVITRDVNKVMRCGRFPINFLVNLISLVIASGLAISHSYGKILKILNL